MDCEIKELVMSDGNVNFVYHWIPPAVDHVVVLSHGMSEHSARYERFAEFLNVNNIALIAEDHRGHGRTGLKAEHDGTGRLAFLSDRDGFSRVSEDIHEELLYARNLFPDKRITLFGHSFGSFIAQNVIERYGDCMDSAVLCGTAGPRHLLIMLAGIIGTAVKKIEGPYVQGRLMNFLTFGFSNAGIKKHRTPFDWLSRDGHEVDLYINDPLCGIPATNGFLCDIYSGLSVIHKKENINSIPKELPVLIIAGTDDPVGSYGKSVKRLYDCYIKSGMKNVSIKLYSGARHELLNETNRQEVMDDALSFIKTCMQ